MKRDCEKMAAFSRLQASEEEGDLYLPNDAQARAALEEQADGQVAVAPRLPVPRAALVARLEAQSVTPPGPSKRYIRGRSSVLSINKIKEKRFRDG
jgi:hypothetical protein